MAVTDANKNNNNKNNINNNSQNENNQSQQQSQKQPEHVVSPTVPVASNLNITNNVNKLNKMPPMIGLANRKNYNIHVIFTDKDILLPPGKRTTKVYLENEIVTVEGKPLTTAIAQGLITIIR